MTRGDRPGQCESGPALPYQRGKVHIRNMEVRSLPPSNNTLLGSTLLETRVRGGTVMALSCSY